MKTLHFSLIFLIAAPMMSWGAPGRTAAPFLQLGAGARYLAMGESAVAMASDAEALYWNPARLSSVQRPTISLLYGVYAEATNYQYGAYAQNMGNSGSLGLSIQTFSAGDIRQTDVNGREYGDFSPRDNALALGWGQRIGSRSSLGASVKRVESKIVASASTWTMDAGWAYRRSRWMAGAAVRNLGGKLRFQSEADPLPTSFHLDLARFVGPNWLLSGETIFPRSADAIGALGAERQFSLSGGSLVALRLGYNSRSRNVPGLTGVTAGFGWRFGALQLDYAWVPLGEIDQTHRFSLTYRAGPPSSQPQLYPQSRAVTPLTKNSQEPNADPRMIRLKQGTEEIVVGSEKKKK
jgi:hypothetical protein